MFHVLRSAPIVALPVYELYGARYAQRSTVLGCPARNCGCARAPRRRYAVAERFHCSPTVPRQRDREFRPEFTYVYFTRLLERAIEGRSGVSRRDSFWGISLNFQHRFGRRPRRRVGIDRVAIASSAWRKLCSSSFVLTVVGVSDASSNLATAVATHSISVAMSFMVRPGAGRLRWPAREEIRPRSERGGRGRSSGRPTTSVASARVRPAPAALYSSMGCVSPLSRRSCSRPGICSGDTESASPKAPSMFIDAGAVRLGAPS